MLRAVATGGYPFIDMIGQSRMRSSKNPINTMACSTSSSGIEETNIVDNPGGKTAHTGLHLSCFFTDIS